METWIRCAGRASGGPLEEKVGDSPVVGPFEDEGDAKDFSKTDPIIPLCFDRKITNDPTKDERQRSITPQQWTALGEELMGAVWIKPLNQVIGDVIGPFEDDGQATQFAKDDSRIRGGDLPFSESIEFELRRGITPDDLIGATSPSEWRSSGFREDRASYESHTKPTWWVLLQIGWAVGALSLALGLPQLVDLVRPGFSGQLLQCSGTGRGYTCITGQYVLYVILVGMPVAFLVLFVPGWIWRLIRRTAASHGGDRSSG